MSDTAAGVADDSNNKRSIHSFIVRVWLEASGTEMEEEIWRGHIIHLPGRDRYYFSDLSEISKLIEVHLKGQE